MSLEVEIVPSLERVSAEEWNALCGSNDPFTQHGFLRLLELSGSVGPARTGWLPCHVLARRGRELVGALPLYLKHHSYGEFIFDFGWAQAASRAGLAYYPKLVSAVPLTPATGRRLLVRSGESERAVASALIEAARSLAITRRASSLHVLFSTPEEAPLLAELGLHPRLSIQYHWQNAGTLGGFGDFMAALRNPSRKQVRKERERAQAAGLTLTMRPVSELPERDIEAMWTFYNQTIDNHGSQAYLTHAFFQGLVSNPHAYAAMAHDANEPVAGALFFYKDQALFGRYWGATREVPMLHFELCYYLPMEWGLARGMRRFEAGAQGEHKIKRGFLPNACHSAHWAVHQGLDRAIAEFVREESRYVAGEMELLTESTPFKRANE